MPHSYKGSISFGLVYIPITLHNSVKNNDVGFNLIDKKTMSRIKYKKISAEDGREVKSEDIVKGYEYESGKYVIMDEKDFDRIKTKKEKSIVIEKFVDLNDIDPIYYDRPYYVKPTGAENAYSLLIAAMEKTGKVGVAKTVLGTKENLIVLRADKGKLTLHTLFFADEIQKNPVETAYKEPNPAELKMAESIIEGMSGTFRTEEYHDEYGAKVKDAIERKIAGKQIVRTKEKPTLEVVDLMDALQASIQTLRKTPDGKKTARPKAAVPIPPKTQRRTSAHSKRS